jgi:PKD repeat protein
MLTQKAIFSFQLRLILIGWAILICNDLMAQSPVASFSTTTSTGCAPLNVQFTNTSQNAASYSWNFGNGNTSVLQNPSNVYLSSGTYTVILTATNVAGQSSSHSKIVTVVASPVANFTVSTNSGCQSSQVFNFQNTSLNYDSCLWDFGDGTTSSVTNPQHIYNIAGVFNVTLIAFNKAFGCSNTKTQTALITVNPKPDLSFVVNDSITCDSAMQFQFNASANNIVSWSWDFGDGQTASIQNPNHVYNDTGYFSITAIAVSVNGCAATLTKQNYIHIKYNPKPAVTISDTIGCMPHLVYLTSNNYANTLYSWNLGNGVTTTGSTIIYNYLDSGIFPITLNVNYSNGCQQIVNAGPIIVLQKPNFTFWMTNITGCAPLNVQCINQSSGAYSWLWDFGDGNTSTQMTPSHVYLNPGIYSVNLTGTSTNGCTYSYTQGLKVNVSSPEAALSLDVTSGCPPLMVNFTNNSTGAVNYLWDFGDGTTSTDQHPSHFYTNAGVYTLKLIVTSILGCTDTLIYPTTINVNAPIINYISPAPIIGCAPFAANFADNSASSHWLWDFGDGTTSTLSNPQHTYVESGTYIVSLTTWGVNGGCERTTTNFQTFYIDKSDPGFIYTVSDCPPYVVQFTDTSHNAVAWNWSFSDGGHSTDQHAIHTFPGIGYFNVSLTTTTANGCPTNISISNGVHVTGLGANPTMTCIDTVAPYNVSFQANSSNATWWLWDFGDGSTSNLQNPTHIYTSNGPFSLTLTVGNDSCTYILDYPNTSLGNGSGGGGAIGGGGVVVVTNDVHCAPFNVQFYSPLSSGLSWLWDFGDGHTSNDPNPSHTYTDSGAFIPSVIITGLNGINDTMFYPLPYYVVKPVTDFTINTTNLCNGVVVTASTINAANSYHWNFGNGLSFNTSSATCNYPIATSSYLISLNITDTNQCNSYIAKSFQVSTSSPISSNVRRSCANVDIEFNAGAVNYQNYFWDFGDGNTSNVKHPIHAYQDAGSYQVMLIVTDINACTDTFNLAYQIEVFNPIAHFTYSAILSNCGSGAVLGTVTNMSTGSDSWLWQFGDGSTSSLFSPPTHAFYMPNFNGFYDITLIASKNICRDTLVIPNAIFAPKLNADFTYDYSSDCVPSIATFTDESVDAVSWFWNFGDGDTSTLQNPIHQYLISPRDSITLTVKDMYGCVKTKTLPAPNLTQASFVLSESGGCAPFLVQFSDSSKNAESWNWSLGDGNSSIQQNPYNLYVNDGFFNISLVVTSLSGCTDTLSIDSLVEVNTPFADFSISNDSGCAPSSISFYDLSTNVKYWEWDFGDGSTSSNQNPNHIYTNPGNYTVRLITQNVFGCTDTITKTNMINVRGAIPDFSVSSTNGCAPVYITFNNLSTGAISYYWSFGDGSTDSTASVTHSYSNQGNFTASLYAYDSTGCSTIYSYPDPIIVGDSPVLDYTVSASSGCSPFAISISDYNTIADSIVWDMGDGSIVIGPHPVYTYQNAGQYLIKLIAYNNGGCVDSLIYPDTINVYQTPTASFTSNSQIGCNPLPIQFNNTSSNLSNASYTWNFGNQDSSLQNSPLYTYLNSGNFTPYLVVVNKGGCRDTFNIANPIVVYDQALPLPTSISYVTVLNNSSVKISWPVSNEPDITKYIIYRLNSHNGYYDSIASVLQPSTPFIDYTDVGLNTLNNSYTYKVQAYDYCGGYQPLSNLVAHKTIEVSVIGGFMKNDLRWNHYLGCDFSHYEVYRKDNINSSLVYLTSVPKSINNYQDTTAYCEGEYTYQIKAVSICGDARFDSWSDTTITFTISDLGKQFVDITRTTVVNDSYTLTEWTPPAYRSDLITSYNIYRSLDQVNYSLIATVPSQALSYDDNNVNVDAQNYYYKVEIVNVCNMTTLQGRIGSSILLYVYESEISNILKWTKYSDWDSGVEKYVIEKLNTNGNWEQTKVVPAGITEWEEE